YPIASGEAKGKPKRNCEKARQKRPKRPQNANDHEQRARVHPAQPSYSVVVPAPELSSINVAVDSYMGIESGFRKGLLVGPRRGLTAAPPGRPGPGRLAKREPAVPAV